MRARRTLVDELVVGRLPRLPAVARALDDLPEPAARLRRIQPVRISGRSLEVVDLPASEMRTADVPFLALAIGRQHERALARAHEHSYSTHLGSSGRCLTYSDSVRPSRNAKSASSRRLDVPVLSKMLV